MHAGLCQDLPGSSSFSPCPRQEARERGAAAAAQLRTRIAPYMLRREKGCVVWIVFLEVMVDWFAERWRGQGSFVADSCPCWRSQLNQKGNGPCIADGPMNYHGMHTMVSVPPVPD